MDHKANSQTVGKSLLIRMVYLKSIRAGGWGCGEEFPYTRDMCMCCPKLRTITKEIITTFSLDSPIQYTVPLLKRIQLQPGTITNNQNIVISSSKANHIHIHVSRFYETALVSIKQQKERDLAELGS